MKRNPAPVLALRADTLRVSQPFRAPDIWNQPALDKVPVPLTL